MKTPAPAAGGNAGNIILSGNALNIQGSLDTSAAGGNAGNIIISGNALNLTGRLSSDTSGVGDGGDITITVTNAVNIDGGSINSQVLRAGREVNGTGGSITINAGSLHLSEGAQINAFVNGAPHLDGNGNVIPEPDPIGDAGNITIDVGKGEIRIDGSGEVVVPLVFSTL